MHTPFDAVLANLASATILALAPYAIVLADAGTATLFANGFVLAVFANAAPSAVFAISLHPIVHAYASAFTLLATSLRAVMNAEMAGWGAHSAGVLDFVVHTDVWALALPTHCVSSARRMRDGRAWDAPAHTPSLAMIAENTAATITALRLESEVNAEFAASAQFAARPLRPVLANSISFAQFARIFFPFVNANCASTAITTLGLSFHVNAK